MPTFLPGTSKSLLTLVQIWHWDRRWGCPDNKYENVTFGPMHPTNTCWVPSPSRNHRLPNPNFVFPALNSRPAECQMTRDAHCSPYSLLFAWWFLDQQPPLFLSPSIDCSASCLFGEEVKITEKSSTEWSYNATNSALQFPSDTKLSLDSLLISLC